MSRVEFVDQGRLWTIGWDPNQLTWFAAHDPRSTGRDRTEIPTRVVGARARECATPAELIDRLRVEHQLVPSAAVQQVLTHPDIYSDAHTERFWEPAAPGVKPWQVGTEQQRWDGYLDPAHFDPVVGQNVMRNLVKATTSGGPAHSCQAGVACLAPDGWPYARGGAFGMPADADLEWHGPAPTSRRANGRIAAGEAGLTARLTVRLMARRVSLPQQPRRHHGGFQTRGCPDDTGIGPARRTSPPGGCPAGHHRPDIAGLSDPRES